ncbi:MAG: HPP family protein [Thermodesulfobacteriota bacterium]|nr:HPP family protein [Thermodesulfobacteriota bacterium]
MNKKSLYGPQNSLLFSVVAFFSRLQFRYFFQTMGNRRFLVVIFVFTAGATALGIITIAAYATDLPLLFPPLGPSAFILFHTPLSESASPRNVILSHTFAIISGLFSLYTVGKIFPEADLLDPSVMNLYRVIVIALSMGLIGVIMICLRCVHPPAAASALIATMGYLDSTTKIFGFLGAVVLLVFNAFFFNRLLGGLPYPAWRSDLKVSRNYSGLSGIPDTHLTFWQHLTAKIFQRRS